MSPEIKRNVMKIKKKLLIYILIMKANKMVYFSNSFGKVLYMFRTSRMSIMRSITTLYTRIRYASR